MHRNTEERACDPLPPRIRELDACDFGQNVNPDRRNSDLIDHLLPGERLRRDPILLEGSTKLPERSNDTGGIFALSCGPTRRDLSYTAARRTS